MKRNATDQEIMSYLGVTRWTERCNRMRTFMSQSHHPEHANYGTTRSSDFHWGSRRNRTCVSSEIIGCDQAGPKSNYYIWAFAEEGAK